VSHNVLGEGKQEQKSVKFKFCYTTVVLVLPISRMMTSAA